MPSKAVFFYGLFMGAAYRKDPSAPRVGQRAVLTDYALIIETRATLIPRIGAKAWGLVEHVDDAELDALYTGPAMASYKPVPVICRSLEEGDAIPAVTYIAPLSDAPADPAYVLKLVDVLRSCGLPPESWEGLKSP
jgi:Gamma-glutamyl cyclotransferase, AIG2-like